MISIWVTGRKKNKIVTLDTGHFHLTESIADKVSRYCCLRRDHVARKPSDSLGQRPCGDLE